MLPMYFSIRAEPCVTKHHRHRGGTFARWLAAAVIAGVLSGCSTTAPSDPSVPEQSTAATTSPATSATSSPPTSRPTSSTVGTPSPDASTSTTTATAATEPPGTVVPFRTVQPDSAVGQRIGLIASTGTDTFSREVTDSIVTQVKAAGAELISCDPVGNPTLVLDCAHRLATQQVDGWITVQPGDVGEALCAAGPQGVPLIAIAAAPVSCETAEVGADDRRAGFLVGMALGQNSRLRAACADDTLVIVADGASQTHNTQRTAGIRAGFATECPGPLSSEVVLDAATQDGAYLAFTNALSAIPDKVTTLVAAIDDSSALGAAAAIPSDRADHITLAAIGADQRARCEIIANPRWMGDAALFPDRYGEIAVPALLDALQGQEIPRNMYIETTFVTADSLPHYYDISDCP